MLLVVAILLTILGLAVLIMIAFANGMSDSPGTSISFWPAWLVLVLAIACFVARHFLHGKSITW